MPQLTADQLENLIKMDRTPIYVSEEIWFGGNEVKQKTPGMHHLEEYRTTGTYNHPLNIKVRKRGLQDLARALATGKMNTVSFKNKIGNLQQFISKCKEHDIQFKPEAISNMTAFAELLDQRTLESQLNIETRRQSGALVEADTSPTVSPQVFAAEAVVPNKLLDKDEEFDKVQSTDSKTIIDNNLFV